MTALSAIGLAVACGGDDAETPPDPGFDADLPDRKLGPDPDADNGDSSVVVTDPPSYCNGIVFYASLDGAYGPERGGTPGSPHGNAKLVAGGKFGGATSLFQVDAGAGEAGAAVYYHTPPDGGVAWYPDKIGTVSLWYRGGMLEDPGSPVLWRVVGSIPPDAVIGGGLTLVALANDFGIVTVNNAQQTQTLLTFPRTSIRPYVNPADYNHFVTGWQRGDAATPTAVMMINGGTGKVFDASADAPSYADAQPNEAGDLLVPYRASRARGWDVDASALAFRLGGTSASAADGEIDDVVVWNRLLSFSEMEALYAATTPVGVTCQLK